MKVGIVVDNLISTNKLENLVGLKFLKIEINDEIIVAVDKVGAGINDQVIVAQGSVCQSIFESELPVDACIIGVVDSK